MRKIAPDEAYSGRARSRGLTEEVVPRCPACRSGRMLPQDDGQVCANCGHRALLVGGNIDLRLDPTSDTSLDLDSYDVHHKVNEQSALALMRLYRRLVNTYAELPTERVLEIGAGTGNLTWGLCQEGGFAEVHSSDISPRFMAVLLKKLEREDLSARRKLRTYLFDANDLPFFDASFDVVVGHSILHHLGNFEATLGGVFRVLKPGGTAIFGEPMMETHALISLAASLVLRVDDMGGTGELSPRSRLVLSVIAKHGEKKAHHLNERPDQVHRHEDKFVFPADWLRRVARDIGFSRYELDQWGPVTDLGAIIEGQLKQEMTQNGASPDELDRFRPVLEAFTEAYQPAMRPFVRQPFCMSIFVR